MTIPKHSEVRTNYRINSDEVCNYGDYGVNVRSQLGNTSVEPPEFSIFFMKFSFSDHKLHRRLLKCPVFT